MEDNNNDKSLQLDELSKVTNNDIEQEEETSDVQSPVAEEDENSWKAHWDLLLSFAILAVILVLEYGFKIELSKPVALVINGIAYLLAGRGVLALAFRKSKRGDVFNEFVLMSVATIGAFAIGEFEEGVAVMLFYQIGEWFQSAAVNKAKRNIKALLDIRPDAVTVLRDNNTSVVDPSKVNVGETIQVKPGEKVALDGGTHFR